MTDETATDTAPESGNGADPGFDLTDDSRGSDEVPTFGAVPVVEVAPETFLEAIITHADGTAVRDFTDRITAYAQAGLLGGTVIPIGVAYHVADDGG